MQSSRSRTRPLGSVRHSVTALDKRNYLPRLTNASDVMSGIQGSAISVPPPKKKTERVFISQMQSSGFLNLTSGIKDPSIFIPPGTCTQEKPKTVQTIPKRKGMFSF